ncbi:hypothetical protein [Thermovibrio ammonificans]
MFRLVAAVLLVVLSYFVMERAERFKPVPPAELTVPLFSYEKLLLSFPTFKGAAADAVYIYTSYLLGAEAVGKFSLSCKEWMRVVKNLEVATRLDPRFFDPYYMLGAYLPWKVKGCKGALEEINGALLRGEKFIDDWRIPFFIGFNYFYFQKERAKGAAVLKRAASMKGAPSYLKLLVPRLYAKSGRLELAVAATEEELKRVKDEKLRKELRRRLRALERMLLLQRAVDFYVSRFKSCPSSLEELVRKGILSSIPKDPYGGRFVIREGCRVWTTSNLRPVKDSSRR